MDKSKKKIELSAKEIAENCAALATDKQGENVMIINLDGETAIADYFVIVGANSEPHLQALSSHIGRTMREKFNIRPYRESGDSAGGWIVLDYITSVVHLMTAETRSRYDLEGLWQGANVADEIKKLQKITAEKHG